MTRSTYTARVANLAVLLATATALSACGDTFTRLSRIGSEPPMTPVQNPAEKQAPVSMPMPAPRTTQRSACTTIRR